MGEIKVKFKAKRNKREIEGEAIVNSGSETSVLSLSDACKLGLDLARAKQTTREVVGGGILTGLRLRNVTIEANGRKAKLEDVFVPILPTEDRKFIDEDALLGQDFLQKSKSFLDFENDTLRGIESLPKSIFGPLSRKAIVRAPTKTEREFVRTFAKCPIKKIKKPKRK